MELRYFRYFVHVAEELHFGRAAARLGISQPPLSQQIRLLEAEIGTPLFARTSRRVILTEAGHLFLAEARRVLEQADHAVVVARRAASGDLGTVTAGFSPSTPFMAVVAEALSAFREACPAVRLDLTEMPRGAQLDALAAGRIDIGFVRGVEPPLLPPGLHAALLVTEPLMVAMRDDHALACAARDPRMEDLRDERFILYEREFGVGFNEHLRFLCARAGFEPNVVQEVTGPSSLLGLVAAGMGITILTRSLGALHPDRLVSRLLDDPDALSRVWLIQRGGLSAAARRFVALVHGGSPDDPRGAA